MQSMSGGAGKQPRRGVTYRKSKNPVLFPSSFQFWLPWLRPSLRPEWQCGFMPRNCGTPHWSHKWFSERDVPALQCVRENLLSRRIHITAGLHYLAANPLGS